jgi:hypothetical protein
MPTASVSPAQPADDEDQSSRPAGYGKIVGARDSELELPERKSGPFYFREFAPSFQADL